MNSFNINQTTGKQRSKKEKRRVQGTRGATHGLHGARRGSRQPEVGYFDMFVLVHEKILGLNIAVDNVPIVQIFDSLQDFQEDLSRFLFRNLKNDYHPIREK